MRFVSRKTMVTESYDTVTVMETASTTETYILLCTHSTMHLPACSDSSTFPYKPVGDLGTPTNEEFT